MDSVLRSSRSRAFVSRSGQEPRQEIGSNSSQPGEWKDTLYLAPDGYNLGAPVCSWPSNFINSILLIWFLSALTKPNIISVYYFKYRFCIFPTAEYGILFPTTQGSNTWGSIVVDVENSLDLAELNPVFVRVLVRGGAYALPTWVPL